MKVLQIYKDYYPPVKGGIEKHINLLSNGLCARGLEVNVLVSSTGYKMESECRDGVRIFKVPQLGRISSAPLNISFPLWIRSLGEKADILHFHFPNPTAELSYLISGLRKRYVVTYHSDIIRQVYLKKLYEPFMHCFLKRAEKIIVTSPQYFRSSATLAKYKESCELIPLGIDFERLNCCSDVLTYSSKIRQLYGAPIVLFVGKNRYYKGIQVLIQAMENINGTLLLIGPDIESSNIKSQIEKNGLSKKVVILGELSDDVLYKYLYACDVFVLPSVQRSEAFGIVQLEAMACGKPVVCTEIGTGTSYVNMHRATGLVVPPKNAKALAEAINFLIHNPILRKKYGESGACRVKSLFSSSQMVDNTMRLYRKILNGKPVSP